jgi:ribonucleoside-triphosphate reductase
MSYPVARRVTSGGEITLEDKELCNVDETCPTVCESIDKWYKACEYATVYASTVSLMPTHQPDTNKVMARNRRIGVGIIDYTGWVVRDGMHKVIKAMRNGYEIVTKTNRYLNGEAGVPEAIKKTTIKPGGTGPKLPGKTSGMGYPTSHETLRRITIARNSPMFKVLVNAGVPYDDLKYDKGSVTFQYPILQGPAKPAEQVTLWEQAMNLVTIQREWSDNAVSNTLYFKPYWLLTKKIKDGIEDFLLTFKAIKTESYKNSTTKLENETEKVLLKHDAEGKPIELWYYKYNPNHEENDIEPVLSMIVPVTKSVALLPHTPKGVYDNMPEESLSKEEYAQRLANISPIDWSLFRGSDGQDERYCEGPSCTIVKD